MNKRLLLLATFLGSIKEELLVINWDMPTIPQKKTKDSKATPGCPVGWACLIFKREQLRTRDSTEGEPVLRYKNTEGMDAVQAFFGITFEEAWSIFTPDGYGTDMSKRQIIARLNVYGRKQAND